MIDRCFTTDGRIYLSQQRCRNLDEGGAALESCRGEADQIADYATTQCNQCCLTLGVPLQQRIKHQIKRLPVLVFLTVRQHDGIDVNLLCGKS